MINKNSIRNSIRGFILDNYYLDDDPIELSDGRSLVDDGIIDSIGILELLDFLEETFEIKIDDNEVIPENMDNIKNIVNFINSKLR